MYRIKVAYHNAFHKLMNITGRVSMSQIFLQYGVDHFNIIMRKRTVGFMNRIALSKNSVIDTIFNCDYYSECAMH